MVTGYEKLFSAIVRSAVAGEIKPIKEPHRKYLMTLPPKRRFQIITKYNEAVKNRNEDRAVVAMWVDENPTLIPVVNKLRAEFAELYAQGKEIPLLPEYYEGLDPDADSDLWSSDNKSRTMEAT